MNRIPRTLIIILAVVACFPCLVFFGVYCFRDPDLQQLQVINSTDRPLRIVYLKVVNVKGPTRKRSYPVIEFVCGPHSACKYEGRIYRGNSVGSFRAFDVHDRRLKDPILPKRLAKKRYLGTSGTEVVNIVEF